MLENRHAFIALPNGKIHVQYIGEGTKLLIAFHGFGRHGGDAARWQPYFQDAYTIASVDLPFHGKSQWNEASFTRNDIVDILRAVAAGSGHTHFALAGHSLGARLILAVLEEVREQVQALYLLAPDGLSTRWMGVLQAWPKSSRPFLGKHALPLLQKAAQKDFLPPIPARFFKHSARKAELVHSWYSLADFRIWKHGLKKQFKQNHFPVYVVLGVRDRVVRNNQIQRFFKQIPNAKILYLKNEHLF